MAILKCKMCGGDINVSKDQTYSTCNYCGSITTLPKISDEQRINLFNRANHFRRLNEFDKAVSAYEQILIDDDTDAEAHWGVVLSRYGIEYVEDPVSHERIPTCNRIQIENILSDPDYLSAVTYAPDGYARGLYEKEAKYISDIQKRYLAISNQEKPYDVFICYKETDDFGNRTKDSMMSQDIYYQLTAENLKVFFSRITLEEQLGKEYEPYIFAALQSAKVMVVVGTSPDNFNAVWVKNEWHRFLIKMKNDKNKMLIPCYRDIDPYNLPEELSVFQSQDMSKIGFMQDLVRGIKKITDKNNAGTDIPSTASSNGINNIALLLKRAAFFLEDGDYTQAKEYYERSLDSEPECAEAYWGKLKAELKITNDDDIVNYYTDIYNKMISSVEIKDEYAHVSMTPEQQKQIEELKNNKYVTQAEIEGIVAPINYKLHFDSYNAVRTAFIQNNSISVSPSYKRAVRYADENKKNYYTGFEQKIIEFIDNSVSEAKVHDKNELAKTQQQYINGIDRNIIQLKENKQDEAKKIKYNYRVVLVVFTIIFIFIMCIIKMLSAS